MYNPLLLLEYTDIYPTDFDNKTARVCFIAIHNLYEEGATKLTIIEVEEEILKNNGASAAIYKNEGGLEFLKIAYEFAIENESNFRDDDEYLNSLIQKYLNEIGSEMIVYFDETMEFKFLTQSGECEFS